MAARPAKQPQNPNTFLVIALIFFILTTIGLGFGTYSGYAIEDTKGEERSWALALNLDDGEEKNRFERESEVAIASVGAAGDSAVATR